MTAVPRPSLPRPSLRMLVAASRLREGQSVDRVARVTRLPLPFVQRLAREIEDARADA